MHIVIRKDLGNGSTSITTAGNWDGLKYQLTKLDVFDTEDWDHRYAIKHLRDGEIVNDGVAIWRYFNVTSRDFYGTEIFNGPVIFLQEIDPTYD